jgi:hypothetical protein
MKFRPDKRRNPFDDFALSFCTHAVALGGTGMAVYWSAMDHSFMPLGLAFAVLTGLEGLWMYYSARR